MITANDVAQFFIMKGLENEEEGISNLKLQKLLYYAKGFYLAIFGSNLFPERLEAWTHGPVVPEIYHRYKLYGSNPINQLEYNSIEKFTKDQIDFLNEIWSVFGQYSAWKLRDMTHNEKPWTDHEADASVIKDDELRNYFLTRLRNG
jgi:uncharacterized phage-associated protein